MNEKFFYFSVPLSAIIKSGGNSMLYIFMIMAFITVLYGFYTFFASRTYIIFLFLLIATFLAYCGMRLNDIYSILKKTKSNGSSIPKSEAKKDFRYLYVCTSTIKNDAVRDGIESLFKGNGYQIVTDVESLDDAAKEKVIWAYFKYKKETKGPGYTVTFYGKNKDGQTVYSVTKKNYSLGQAKQEAFEALKI